MIESALLEVRVFPWRRKRMMRPETLREAAFDGDFLGSIDDLGGLVVVLAVWLTIIVAAPVVVLVLAGLLFSVEIPLLILVAALLVLGRFAGIIPWTVLVLDRVTGAETRHTYRNFFRAVRRVREVNGERRVAVHWAWI